MTTTLSVGVWNIEKLGWSRGKGHHRLPDALDFLLAQTPVPPDVLALPEATHILDDGEDVLRRQLVYPLAQHLEDGWYEPFYASDGVPGRNNHYHLLLVNTPKIKPLGWHDPSRTRPEVDRHAGSLSAEIHGHGVKICCEHWPGGNGRTAFDQAVNRVSTLGGDANATLLLGDFNATSSWEGEPMPADWHEHCRQRGELHKLKQKGWINPATGRWEIDTRQIDELRSIFGFRDLGEEHSTNDSQEAGATLAPTTHPDEGSGLRIDRIFRSTGFPGHATRYESWQPPREISDHAFVFGVYTMRDATTESQRG